MKPSYIPDPSGPVLEEHNGEIVETRRPAGVASSGMGEGDGYRPAPPALWRRVLLRLAGYDWRDW